MYFPEFETQPITDRTQADVNAVRDDPTLVNAKGALNYSDLNRIEENYEECADALRDWGYPIRRASDTMTSGGYPWAMATIPYLSYINTIRDVGADIVRNFMPFYENTLRYSTEPNYEDINILEDVALQTYNVLHRISDSTKKCNEMEAICGVL